MRTLKFCYLLLCLGFILGTLTLNLIVENITSFIRHHPSLASAENIIIICIIALYLIFTIYLCRKIFVALRNVSHRVEVLFYVLLTGALITCLAMWLSPSRNASQQDYLVTADGRFITGPYPDREKMIALKKEGYSIISLLSPYVAPFEPVLINKEIALAREVGIDVIQAPMLPWISDNQAAITVLQKLAQEKSDKKYYLHCYYGRDRAYMAMRIIHTYSPVTAFSEKDATISRDEHLSTIPFERGLAINIDRKIIVSPNPTPEEFLILINNRKNELNEFYNQPLKKIYSIQTNDYTLFPEEEHLKKLGVDFKLIHWNDFPYDPMKILSFVKELKSDPHSTLVYSFYTTPNNSPLVLDGILVSYLTNLPALPRLLLAKSHMSNGHSELIAPNILIGPEPTQTELKRYLYDIGVRHLAYIGDCKHLPDSAEDAAEYNRRYHFSCFFPTDSQIPSIIATNGPWYVYGPGLAQIENTLKKTFANSFPTIDTSPTKQ